MKAWRIEWEGPEGEDEALTVTADTWRLAMVAWRAYLVDEGATWDEAQDVQPMIVADLGAALVAPRGEEEHARELTVPARQAHAEDVAGLRRDVVGLAASVSALERRADTLENSQESDGAHLQALSRDVQVLLSAARRQ